MNSFEKVGKMLSLEPYKDRTEIPVYPMMVGVYGKFTGHTQKDMFVDPDVWFQAVDETLELIGHPDMLMPAPMAVCPLTMGLPMLRPGFELDDDEQYRFEERPFFDDPAEYKRIYEMGWGPWYFSYVGAIQKPPIGVPEVVERFQGVGELLGRTIGHFAQHGIAASFSTCTYPIYDALSLIRSFEEFTLDLVDDPGPIMDIVRKYQPLDDENNINLLKATGGTSICLFAMRSSATFLSPEMFEEYVWPNLKAQILRFHEAGITVVIHADANWLPMLPYFTQLPKGCCHIELDGATDIFAAYDILKGSQSIRGDVPSTLFAYESADAVSEYCERLVQMGMGGGFCLGSGCEIPLNAKLENVIAMMDAVR